MGSNFALLPGLEGSSEHSPQGYFMLVFWGGKKFVSYIKSLLSKFHRALTGSAANPRTVWVEKVDILTQMLVGHTDDEAKEPNVLVKDLDLFILFYFMKYYIPHLFSQS